MKCPDVIGFLSPYLDSELDTATTFQIQAHLGNCESCRKRFDQEGELELRMVASLRPQPSAADDAMWNRIMTSAVPAVRAPRLVEPPRRPFGFRWLLLIASMLIVSSAGLGLGFSSYKHRHVNPDLARRDRFTDDQKAAAAVQVSGNHRGSLDITDQTGSETT